MTDEDEELEASQTDEIGRRMAGVIDEQEEEVSEHVQPHWEVFYDGDKEGAERITHLHGAEKVPAQVTANSNGESLARCTQCDATLEISGATLIQRETGKSAPVS
jgi:hypothetical protein